jgi:hypothetical protein
MKGERMKKGKEGPGAFYAHQIIWRDLHISHALSSDVTESMWHNGCHRRGQSC